MTVSDGPSAWHSVDILDDRHRGFMIAGPVSSTFRVPWSVCNGHVIHVQLPI
jgi:hypothetical protein